jgi:hypothetical protein
MFPLASGSPATPNGRQHDTRRKDAAMTSSTPTTAAANGGTSTPDPKPEHGLVTLRRREAQGLIQVVSDALYESERVASEIRTAVNAKDGIPYATVQQQLLDALACVETADHYLRMLDEVIDPEPLSEEPIPYEPVSGEPASSR